VVAGAGSVLYAATDAEQHGWGSARVLGFFALGAVALAAFAYFSLVQDREPLLDLRLFKNRVFFISSLIGYVTVVGLFGAEFLMPVYLQALRGRSAFHTGLIVLPLAIVSGFVIPVAGRLYDKVGPRALVAAGFLVLTVNTWQLAKIERDTTIAWILFLLALRGLALGLTVQTTFVAALSVIQGPAAARGTSLINSTRFIVQAIGVAVLATVLSSTLSPAVKEFSRQAQEQAAAADVRPAGICEAPGSEFGPPADTPPQVVASLDAACQQNVDGFEKAYELTFYLAIVATAIALFLPGWPGRWAGRGSESGPRGKPAPAH
jgi:DHA2 family multidrug resistance protein